MMFSLFLIICSSLQVYSNLPQFSAQTSEVIYLGMENYIYIKLNNSNPEEISLKSSPGNIYKRDDTTYVINPQYTENDLKVKLYYKNVICEIKTLEVKKLPDLIPVLDKEKGGFIHLSDLSSVKTLLLDFPPDYPDNLRPRILSYNLYLIDKSGVYLYSTGMRDNLINDQVINAFKSLLPGSKIQINNIAFINKQNVMTRLNINKEILVIE